VSATRAWDLRRPASGSTIGTASYRGWVARLILLNGAPGSGKSTLARRFAEEHALTLVLDIDQVRGMLGRWLDEPTEAGGLARKLAVAMARAQLRAGHDVVVPQYLGRLEFVETLQELAVEVGDEFVELALLSDRDDVVRRFERRSATSDDVAHRQAAELQRRTGGREQLASTHDKLLAVLVARPATRVITTTDGDIDGAYAQLLVALSS
jgi:predicted kinase